MPAFFSEFQETSFKWQREKDLSFLKLKVAAKISFNATFSIARMRISQLEMLVIRVVT